MSALAYCIMFMFQRSVISHSISPNTLVLLASAPIPLGSRHSLQIAVDCASCASCAGSALCTAVNATFWRSRSVQPAVPGPLDPLVCAFFHTSASLCIALLFLFYFQTPPSRPDLQTTSPMPTFSSHCFLTKKIHCSLFCSPKTLCICVLYSSCEVVLQLIICTGFLPDLEILYSKA